ncbi:hypothetical protein EDC65_2653 [Stella humosa]|uniref:Uncharacterized protein n=1 Tax=Stella humosa TaxID=94 RepID=A0A3N1LHU0_9PROT|nr:hypothetical protein [Stella humosa]ROP90794.1 hypothetical protein EDC65_2653 [Stella humosa]BBK34860.1 hypothetical protein STHU_54940 [Stella humosa]
MASQAPPSLRSLPLDPASLHHPLEPTPDRASYVSKLLLGDLAGYGGLTAADLLYDAFRLDPTAIAGIDFVRSEDLSDIFRFSKFACDIQAMAPAKFAGNIAQLKGYVAERAAAAALMAEGADVSFPGTATEPGWDLLVNGDRFQVKCLGSPRGVYEHIDRYPDIPVITNCELAPFFNGDVRVMPITSLSNGQVEATTRSTLNAGTDLLDLQIPLIASGVAAARAGLALLRQESDPASAIGAAAAQAMGGTLGGKAGSVVTAAGLGLLGVTGGWLLIIGPAIGSAAGMWGSRLALNALGRTVLCRSSASALDGEMRAFAAAAAEVVQRMLDTSSRHLAAIETLRSHSGTFATALHVDWRSRVEREIEHRTHFRHRLRAAAAAPGSIDPSLSDPREVAARLMWTAARAGVLPVNVGRQLQALHGSAKAYGSALQRWLLR